LQFSLQTSSYIIIFNNEHLLIDHLTGQIKLGRYLQNGNMSMNKERIWKEEVVAIYHELLRDR
jgi:hypothetical protein